MVKNEQNLHFKHPNGELAMDGVVKKFTIKKGVLTNMARKTTQACENAKEETRTTTLSVFVLDPRYPNPEGDGFRATADKMYLAEVRRAVATRLDFKNLRTYEMYTGVPLSLIADKVHVDIIKGISYYYFRVYVWNQIREGIASNTVIEEVIV